MNEKAGGIEGDKPYKVTSGNAVFRIFPDGSLEIVGTPNPKDPLRHYKTEHTPGKKIIPVEEISD